MKKIVILMLTGLIAAAGLVPATVAVAGSFDVQTSAAVEPIQAPSLNELRRMLSPPFRSAANSSNVEVPNITVPEHLKGVINVDAPETQGILSLIEGLAPAASMSFGGYDNPDNAALLGFRVAPPDTEGDVGLTHYVQWNNLGLKIFLKDGTLVNGPNGDPGTIFWADAPGHPCLLNNHGDPIVLYDHVAGRWLFSQFVIGPGLQCVAISAGEDPSAGPYTLYAFAVGLEGFNDYPKMGLWTTADGGNSAYHLTTNEFGGAGFLGVQLTALDRDSMLAALPAATASTVLTPSIPFAFSLQPGHLEGPVLPPAGTCETYIQVFDDETWAFGGGPDGYRTWQFCADFDRSNFSVAENPLVETGFEFDSNMCDFSRDCIPQPGTDQKLDVLGQFTMYRFAVRDLHGSLSGVISHTVDLGGDVAGVQWAQFDMTGPVPTLADVGQLDVGDGDHRWMPSISQDQSGNIAIGYSVSSSSHFPSMYFTGRRWFNPPHSLQVESSCIDGTGSQLGVNRWGDYSTVSIDPADDCTFWITNEYVETTGTFNWDTQICTFKFTGCGDPRVEITSGNDVDLDSVIDRVVEVGITSGAAYDYTISYFNPGAPDVRIRDIVPAEWDVMRIADPHGEDSDVETGGLTGRIQINNGDGPVDCTVVRADNRRNEFGDNHIDCVLGDAGVMTFWLNARCAETRSDPTCHPKTCGAFYLNEGAIAINRATRLEVEGPSDSLCLAAVRDINGGGLDYSGDGDEDGDGVSDYVEACVNLTNPCIFNP